MKTKEEILGQSCYPHEIGGIIECFIKQEALKAMQLFADQESAKAVRAREDEIKEWVDKNYYCRFHTLEDSEEFLNFLRTSSTLEVQSDNKPKSSQDVVELLEDSGELINLLLSKIGCQTEDAALKSDHEDYGGIALLRRIRQSLSTPSTPEVQSYLLEEVEKLRDEYKGKVHLDVRAYETEKFIEQLTKFINKHKS